MSWGESVAVRRRPLSTLRASEMPSLGPWIRIPIELRALRESWPGQRRGQPIEVLRSTRASARRPIDFAGRVTTRLTIAIRVRAATTTLEQANRLQPSELLQLSDAVREGNH